MDDWQTANIELLEFLAETSHAATGVVQHKILAARLAGLDEPELIACDRVKLVRHGYVNLRHG